MAKVRYTTEEMLARPSLPGIFDPTQIYFHFRPARPANLLVTRDPQSGEINVSAGTYGVLRTKPLTIALHIAKKSYDSLRNTKDIGTACVIALPGKDLVHPTWVSALPVPRGISEADIAKLTLMQASGSDIPGIAECPVNLQCRIEDRRDNFSHVVLILEVTSVSISNSFSGKSRSEAIAAGPTYEVDDQLNAWSGSVERLGVNGELLACPGFPVGPKIRSAGLRQWLLDLQHEKLIEPAEYDILIDMLDEWDQGGHRWSERKKLRIAVDQVLHHLFWSQWDEFRTIMSSRGKLVHREGGDET